MNYMTWLQSSWLCLALSLQPPTIAQEFDFSQSLKRAKTVIFLGDSITYSGDYIARLDAWLELQDWPQKPDLLNLGLPSETLSGLSEKGHAGGKFPRPVLSERLERVITSTQPDLIIACYGINCGIYQPLDQERFQKFQQGVLGLVNAAKSVDVELILMTPPTFDDLRSPRDFSYDEVMGEYSDWLITTGRQQKWQVIDLHGPMLAELQKLRKQTPPATMQPDGVHPNALGHQFIAQQLIRQLTPKANLQPPNRINEVLPLVKKRQDLRRNAWLSHTGHQRPGLPQGKPLDDAKSEADLITQKISRLAQ